MYLLNYDNLNIILKDFHLYYLSNYIYFIIR